MSTTKVAGKPAQAAMQQAAPQQAVVPAGQAPALDKAENLRDQFDKMGPQIKMALPTHVPVERFMRVVMTAINGDPKLARADRRSLFASCMKAAQDGLLPDGREGALVIFRAKTKVKQPNGREIEEWVDKVQWMPMIQGVLKKARNSGEILSIAAHVVHANDAFTYVLGDDERIEHHPKLGDRGDPIAVYAIAKTKDGGIYREIMTVEDVEKVRAVSKSKDSGPWGQWWSEMARKTVLRRLSKRLPTSADLDDLIRRDDELYDLQGGRAETEATAARLFSGPVANPLSDQGPGTMIEHDPETGEVSEGGGDTVAAGEPGPEAGSSSADPAATHHGPRAAADAGKNEGSPAAATAGSGAGPAAKGAAGDEAGPRDAGDHLPLGDPAAPAAPSLAFPASLDPASPEGEAWTRGVTDRRKGVARRACPPEYRAAGREPECDAWRMGWDASHAMAYD